MIPLLGFPPETWLPFVFAGVMALAIFAYVVLDGYDLGVGMIMAAGDRAERDRMINTIAPFWDINEVWLVLGIGVLLTAFPKAHGIILTALYLPVAMMLTGLILRGVAFKFRTKAHARLQNLWDMAFIAGSTLASLAQGYMIGRYLLGFRSDMFAYAFAAAAAIGVVIAYIFIGACWLILKSEGQLRDRAIRIAGLSLFAVSASFIGVSLLTPAVSPYVYSRWFTFPQMLLLLPAPLLAGLVMVWLYRLLGDFPCTGRDKWPFLGALALFVLGFSGLAWSFYPYLVPDQLTIWQAAASPQSLWIIFLGVIVVLPIMIISMIYTYHVFRGKAEDLHY